MRSVTRTRRPDSGARERRQVRGLRVGGRGAGLLVTVGVTVLVGMLLVSAASPPAAQALHIGPIDINPLGGSPTNPLGGLVGGAIGQLAVGGFSAIVKALFSPLAKFVTTQLIGWLVAIPNLTQGNVWRLEQTVVAMGGVS